MVDGYDTLPADAQDKVKRALEQGHVDDDDWKGVSHGCNLYRGNLLTLCRILSAIATPVRRVKACLSRRQ